jgi:hypothetical protein
MTYSKHTTDAAICKQCGHAYVPNPGLGGDEDQNLWLFAICSFGLRG